MMTILRLYFFIVLLAVNCSNIWSLQYSEHSMLVTRAPGKDAYLRELAWYEIKRDADNSKNCIFASSFQLNFFYQKLARNRDVGSYFGVKGKGCGISYKGGFGTSTLDIDLNSEALVHDAIIEGFEFHYDNIAYRYKKPDSTNHDGTVVELANSGTQVIDPLTNLPKLGPTVVNATNLKLALAAYAEHADGRSLAGAIDLQVDRRVWGALLSYYAYTASGFWMQFDLPVLQVKNKLIPTIKHEKKLDDPELSRHVSILDLICGDYSSPQSITGPKQDNPDAQNKLLYSKFSRQEMEKSGVGDLDITLGYRLADHEKFDCDGFCKITIPTAEEVGPEYLFAPQLGNNGHFAMALGACCSSDIWTTTNWSIEGLVNTSVSYSWPKTQQRTLSSLVDRGVVLPWDRYILVQKIGAKGPLSPGANIFTTDVDVFPGISTETVLSLGFRGHSFIGNLGVSFFARQGECLELKKWEQSALYGKPSVVEYRTTEVFDMQNHPFEGFDFSNIVQKNLSLMAASTPGSISTSFFAQAGYFDQSPNKKPFTACIGCAYEYCNENSALSNFTFWIKAGLAF